MYLITHTCIVQHRMTDKTLKYRVSQLIKAKKAE